MSRTTHSGEATRHIYVFCKACKRSFDATNGEYYATQDNKRWTIIKASVTYFKGEPDDEVILLVPKNAPSRWAAVENIIKQTLVI